MPPGPLMSQFATSSRTASSWPAPTPPQRSPSVAAPSKRKRHRASEELLNSLEKRQIITDQGELGTAAYQCEIFSGNEVQSCFPTASNVFPQHQWATFIWNSRLPTLTQTNLVNIYLVRADSGDLVHKWTDVNNPRGRAGQITYQVNDTWFGDQAINWSGKDITYPLYWMITRNDEPQNSGIPQATFSAAQTTYADFVVAAMASTSASAASASSLSSLLSAESAASASASAASLSLTPIPIATTRVYTSDGRTYTSTGSTTVLASHTGAPGNIQGDGGGSSFPHWAIAVIVILGFFAIVASGILAWIIMRRMRERRAREESARNSMNSASPMIQNAQGTGVDAPLMGEAGLAAGAGAAASSHHRPESVPPGDKGDKGDGASTISRAHSEAAPFSGADAAIMADAFRKALRKPEFPGALEEGDTPESQKERHEAELLNRELADEGRAVRSVASSRDVRVQNPSEGGNTIQDNRSSYDG